MGRQQIKFGETQTIQINKGSVCGTYITFYIQHNSTNTAFAADFIDPLLIQLKLTLNRDNKDVVLYNGSLRDWFAYSVYNTYKWAQILTNGQVTTSRVFLAPAVGVKEIRTIGFETALPGPVTMFGGDSLTFQVNLPTSAAASTVDTSISYGYIDFLECVGVEEGIPIVNVMTMQGAVASQTVPCGDFVKRIMFLNYNKQSYLSADRVLTDMSLSSDKFSKSNEITQLIDSSLMIQYPEPASTFEPYQSYLIYNGNMWLNNSKVDLTFNSTNVTASQNVLIWGQIILSKDTVERAEQRRKRHQSHNWQQLPQ